MSVHGIPDFQVGIFRGIDAAIAEGIVNPFLCQFFRKHCRSGPGVDPLAAAGCLVEGGSQVPALVQGLDIIAQSFFSACFQQGHDPVRIRGPAFKLLKGSVLGAGMVKLADAAGGCQRSIVPRQRTLIVIVALLLPALKAGGRKGADMAQLIGPGPAHLVAEHAHKVPAGDGGSCRFSGSPLAADGAAVGIQTALQIIVKGFTVVGDSKKVQSRYR